MWKFLNTISLMDLRTKNFLWKIVLTVIEEYVSSLKLNSPCYDSFGLIMQTLCVSVASFSPIPPFCQKKDSISCGPELSYPTLKALTLHISLFAVSSVVLKSSCYLPSSCLGDNAFKEQLGRLLATEYAPHCSAAV